MQSTSSESRVRIGRAGAPDQERDSTKGGDDGGGGGRLGGMIGKEVQLDARKTNTKKIVRETRIWQGAGEQATHSQTRRHRPWMAHLVQNNGSLRNVVSRGCGSPKTHARHDAETGRHTGTAWIFFFLFFFSVPCFPFREVCTLQLFCVLQHRLQPTNAPAARSRMLSRFLRCVNLCACRVVSLCQ